MATALASVPDADTPTPAAPRVSRPVTLAVWLGVVAGFAVALHSLAHPRWFPILDLAQTEMRLRDVFTAHPPLIGLPGRIGTFQHQGSHPGPLSFWLLAPFYRLFGSSAWAVQAATAASNALAIGLSLLIARRRGGTALFFALAAALAAIMYFDGPSVLTQAWNPYLPMTWFVVFVLGVWSVLCDDLGPLPIAAFAGSFCLQTHISYLGLVGGLGGLALVWIAWRLWKAPDALGSRRWWWIGLAATIVVATTIPPIVQELTSSEGNLTLLWRHFTAPPEDPIGMRRGAEVLLAHLNPWRLLAGQDAVTGSLLPGVMLLVAWVAGVIVAIRHRVRSLLALDAVLAVALLLGVYSIASIFGFVWYYLMRWAWSLNALLLVATGWAAVVAVAARRPPATEAVRRAGTAVLVIVTGAYLGGFAIDATDVEPPTPRVSTALGRLVRPTVRAIDAGSVPGGGRAGRYQVTIVDTVTINAPGYGMVSELERAGIHAGFPPIFSAIVRPKRIVTKSEATAVVHISVGRSDIERWDSKPGVEKVATADLRTPAERAEAIRLRRTIRRELVAADRADLVANLQDNIFMATFVPGLPHRVQQHLLRLLDIGEPSAVYIGPARLAER